MPSTDDPCPAYDGPQHAWHYIVGTTGDEPVPHYFCARCGAVRFPEPAE